MTLPALLTTLLLAAKPAPAAPELPPFHARLVAHCRAHAADPANPWALAHGINTFGKEFKASDGTRATQALFRFLKRNPGAEGARLYFEVATPDDLPVEPHPNLLAKTLVLAGVPLGARYDTPVGRVTLGELVAEAKRGFSTKHVRWDEQAWTLDLLGHVYPPTQNTTYMTPRAEQVDVPALHELALAALEAETEPFVAAMKAERPYLEKRRQGLYTHPCGGLHLVQAVLTWPRTPYLKRAWGPRVEAQLDVLAYRVHGEALQYQAAMKQLPEDQRLPLLVQQLKFYGHALETFGRVRAETGLPLRPQHTEAVRRARELLEETVAGLEAAGAFERMEPLRRSQPQVWLDLIGDSCHAAKGLSLTR